MKQTYARTMILKKVERVSKRFTVSKNGCWVWEGSLNNKGYGRVNYKGNNWLAHRFFYELIKGDVPQGLVLDHLCRVPSCVNPNHLEPVTLKVNNQRSISATKTHCKHGHELAGENLYEASYRKCKACTIKNSLDRYYKQKIQNKSRSN